MTIVKEIADALAVLKNVVANTRELVKAVNDGEAYLKGRHPDASKEFVQLLEQMQITVEGLARATGVISSFRFVVGSQLATERDLERLNGYVLEQNEEVVRLRGRIRELKGDCEKIGKLRNDLNSRRKDPSLASMFGLLGMRTSRRRDELAATVGTFYADDLRMINVIEQMLRLSQDALADINGALGKPGHADPSNVPIAAQMLGVYATMFEQPKRELDDLVDALHKAALALHPT